MELLPFRMIKTTSDMSKEILPRAMFMEFFTKTSLITDINKKYC
jgi:hypothetical protein